MPHNPSANSSANLPISVIMIDGSFRENAFSAQSLCNQNFPEDKYEIIWVEFYTKPHPALACLPNVTVLCLNNLADTTYHSSVCFNSGIRSARGEIIVIADADQVFPPDFLCGIAQVHGANEKLVSYAYRYDEPNKGALNDHTIEHLDKVCIYKNLLNYGACMSVRKRWLEEINGYEEHEIFATGFHANGLDVYTRFRNLGLAIQWHPDLKVYHPWHANTLTYAPQYEMQREWIGLRSRRRHYLSLRGLHRDKDAEPTLDPNARGWLRHLTNESIAARNGRLAHLRYRATRKIKSRLGLR